MGCDPEFIEGKFARFFSVFIGVPPEGGEFEGWDKTLNVFLSWEFFPGRDLEKKRVRRRGRRRRRREVRRM